MHPSICKYKPLIFYKPFKQIFLLSSLILLIQFKNGFVYCEFNPKLLEFGSQKNPSWFRFSAKYRMSIAMSIILDRKSHYFICFLSFCCWFLDIAELLDSFQWRQNHHTFYLSPPEKLNLFTISSVFTRLYIDIDVAFLGGKQNVSENQSC